MSRRIMTTENLEEDVRIENHLRPQLLEDYIGQAKAKEMLKIYIEAAKARGEALDHLLFYGPPGLGKTTLAGIIANEMNVNMKITSGPAIEKPGEMAAILNNLQEGDVLFVDEIHRLNRQVEEVLYPAMEDYVIDVMIGKGESARSIRLNLPKFTLVGATTRAGMLSAPLRDRFGVVSHMEYYTVEELRTIILQSAQVLDVEIDEKGAYELARRSRGTPRLANRLLKRVRDFAQVKYDGKITYEVAAFALDLLEVDKMGLDQNDRNIILTIIDKFDGGPVGLDTLAASLGEDSGTIEDVYEPYLVKNDFINRTPKGRVATAFAGVGAISGGALSSINGTDMVDGIVKGGLSGTLIGMSMAVNAVGGFCGGAAQLVSDIINGKASPVESYVGAFVGGAIGNSMCSSFLGGAIGTAVGESLERVDGGKHKSLLEITYDSLVLGGVSKGLNFVSHTAITFDAYYWMKIILNKETENVIEAGLVGASSNVYNSIKETMEEKKGKCQDK